jgi:hypothetical protein
MARTVTSEAAGRGMSVGKLLDRLDGVRQSGAGRWLAKCPAHEDRGPSLSIRETDDGTTLVKCFAGCGAADVVAAAGLTLKDLFPERPAEHRRKPSRAWLDARDVLGCLATEGQVIAIAAGDLADGRTFTPTDADRIAQAAGRVRNAWGAFNGYR